jgi:hypothetical protein
VVNIRREYLQFNERQADSRSFGRYVCEESRNAGAGDADTKGSISRQEPARTAAPTSDGHASQHGGTPGSPGNEAGAESKKVERSDLEQSRSERSRSSTQESEHNQLDERDR